MKRRKDRLSALLAATTEVEGNLTFKGSARVDGRFTGNVTGDGALSVGGSAHLHSDIRSPEVIIGGYVEGSIRGSRRVEINPGGYVKGTIYAPVLVVAEGALFDGRCVMREDEEAGLLPSSG
jgi:cytoskeletal protein CcmA (bactofilin family)